MKAILGIDSSNYCSSVALVSLTGDILVSNRRLLPVPQGQCGLRQSEAVFEQIRQLPQVLTEAFNKAPPHELVALSVSATPTAQEGSYMPVFLVGLGIAQSLAASQGLPLFKTNHQQGHLRAALPQDMPMPDRYLAVHLSGGTTDIMLAQDGKRRLVGRALDLHAGQLIDRIGVAMGLPFPAGPALEAFAMAAKPEARYPSALASEGFHLSGVEAAAKRDLADGQLPNERIAAEVFDALARSLFKYCVRVSGADEVSDVLVTGGVATSILLRQKLQSLSLKRNRDMNFHFARPELSGDNAVGVAWTGLDAYNNQQQGG